MNTKQIRFEGSIGTLMTFLAGLMATLAAYAIRAISDNKETSVLAWVLQLVETKATNGNTDAVLSEIPKGIRDDVYAAWNSTEAYLDEDSKYGLLSARSRVMAVLVNTLRVLTGKASHEQKQAFNYGDTTKVEIQQIHNAYRQATSDANGFTADQVAVLFTGIPAGDSLALATYFGAEDFDDHTLRVIGHYFEEKTSGTMREIAETGVDIDSLEAIASDARRTSEQRTETKQGTPQRAV